MLANVFAIHTLPLDASTIVIFHFETSHMAVESKPQGKECVNYAK